MKAMSFENEFARMHPDHAFIIRYMREALGVDEVAWDDLTAVNLKAVADHIKARVTSNSARTYFAVLKGFLSLMGQDIDLPDVRFQNILKCRREPQQNVALTGREVARIDAYYQSLLGKNTHQVERDVLALFLIECYCGGRGVDVEQMTEANIAEGRLSYVSQKTHILATMPVHRRLRELLGQKPDKEYSRMTKNRVIKNVCKKCGIDEEVTIFYHGKMQTRPKYEYCGFHTARRSFASVLAAKGVPVPEISQYMSHASISMTERYIKVDRNRASAAAMSFFGGA